MQKIFTSEQYLLSLQADEEKQLDLQLVMSIAQNATNAFNTLINRNGVDINKAISYGKLKWTPLMFAVHNRRDKFVEILLNNGADPNCVHIGNNKSILHIAAEHGYGSIVRLLLKTKKISNINYNDNTEGESAIFGAIKRSRKFCVEQLLDYNLHNQICDINVSTNTKQQTPLLIACDKGDIEMVKLLINYKYMKCNINAMDHRGYTPLMKAVAKRYINIVKLLLSSTGLPSPNINLCNKFGQCATMIAIRTNNFKISKYLLNNDDIDNNNYPELYRKDYRGRTILDQCIKYHIDKRITLYVKQLLYVGIHSVIRCVNTSKQNHNIVPYVPHGIVHCICTLTY